MQNDTSRIAVNALTIITNKIAVFGDLNLAQRFEQTINSARSEILPRDRLVLMLSGALTVLSDQPAFGQDCILLRSILAQLDQEYAVSVAQFNQKLRSYQ